jgi:hypothetical protein
MAVMITATNRVGELPPTPILGTDNIPHETGDNLGRATIDELVAFIRSGLSAIQHEIKYIRAPNNAYITDNFDMTIGENQGLGKVGGLWEGWAICNGNNGTDNLDGRTLIGYGANYGAVGHMAGNANAIVVSHNHSLILGQRSGAGGLVTGLPKFSNADSDVNSQEVGSYTTTNGESGINKNYPPFMVILMIQKL